MAASTPVTFASVGALVTRTTSRAAWVASPGRVCAAAGVLNTATAISSAATRLILIQIVESIDQVGDPSYPETDVAATVLWPARLRFVVAKSAGEVGDGGA